MLRNETAPAVRSRFRAWGAALNRTSDHGFPGLRFARVRRFARRALVIRDLDLLPSIPFLQDFAVNNASDVDAH